MLLPPVQALNETSNEHIILAQGTTARPAFTGVLARYAAHRYRNPNVSDAQPTSPSSGELAGALQRRDEELRLFLEAARQLGRTLDLDQIYDLLHHILTQIMPCTTLIVSHYDRDRQLLHCRYVRHKDRRQQIDHLPAIPLEPEGRGVQARAVRSGEAFLVPNWRAEIRRNRTAYLLDDDSNIVGDLPPDEPFTEMALVVPLKLEGEVIGVLQLLSEAPDAYGQRDLEFLEILAAQFAAAASNAMLYRQARQEITERQLAEGSEREQRLFAEALADIAAILNHTLDLDDVLERILQHVGRVAPHQGANIMLIHDGVARVRHYAGYSDQFPISDFLRTHGFDVNRVETMRAMIETRRAIVVEDVHDFEGWLNTDDPLWLRAYAGAPIILDDEVIGFLNLDAATPNYFTPAHADRLKAFADQVAVALRNAQLYEAEQRRRRIAETLIEAAAALNATLDLDQVLLRVLEQLGKVIPYDSAAVQQLDGETLIIRAATGFDDTARLLERRTPVYLQHPTDAVVASRRPLAFADIRTNVPTFPVSGDVQLFGNIRSWLGVPLIVNERVVGVITVDRHEVRPFSPEEMALAQTFANHAALALHNAQLYNSLAHHSDYLEDAVQERTRELQRTVDQMNAIVSNSPQAIILCDLQGAIQHGNPAVEQLFGFDLGRLDTLKLHDLVEHEDAPTLVTALDEAVTQRAMRRLQLTACREDGAIFDADVALVPIVERGKVRSLVCSIHDISGFKEVERMKDAFVSNVSHELRTPISSLKLYHNLVQRDTERSRTYLERMEREIDRLNVIIEDLLRLSRLEQGRVALNIEAGDLRPVVAQHLSDRHPLIRHNGLALTFHDAGDPLPVTMDKGLIGQVVSILLTNALTYTPAGGHIEVGFSHKHFDGKPHSAFYVKDDGPGIALEEQTHLFKRFFRGQSGRRSGASGTGLGLSIAEEIVRRHEGHIELHSTGIAGQGATFWVWLPDVDCAPESSGATRSFEELESCP